MPFPVIEWGDNMAEGGDTVLAILVLALFGVAGFLLIRNFLRKE